jgi:hypothetical protein
MLVLFFIPIFMYSRIRDPVLFYPRIRDGAMVGSRINHPGSATLGSSKVILLAFLYFLPLKGWSSRRYFTTEKYR